MQEVDTTEMVLAEYARLPPDALRRVPSESPPDLHTQAAEMFIWMAEHAVHHIGSGTETYLDYTVPVTGLALTSCLVACERSDKTPDFSKPQRPDPWVHAEFRRQLVAELNREQEARMRHGIWRCWYDREADVAHHRLTRRRRISALMLLDGKAQAAVLQQLLGRSFAALPLDELNHTLAASPEMLHFLTQTDPSGWSKFEAAMGVDAEQLAAISGFMTFLKFAADTVKHSYWYDEAFLLRLWNIHTAAYPQYGSISGEALIAATTAFSMTPSEAATSLMHPPFYRLHGRYLRNPCFIQAQSPIAGLLTIAVRRHEGAWNNTLGSTLARAADTLAAMLPRLERLKVAVRRRFPGGDVDLAVYDRETREMLVCELKTVYDKHNVDSLMFRFEDAKVNVDRASSQLATAEVAITTGQLTMLALFGEKYPPPARVHKALLTWLNPIDLTMGTDNEQIICLNFSLFLFLVHASEGDVQTMALAAHELRNLWAVAQIRTLDLDQPELKSDLEVQTSLLDTRESLATLQLSPLTCKIIKQMATMDDVEVSGDPNPWISYMTEPPAS